MARTGSGRGGQPLTLDNINLKTIQSRKTKVNVNQKFEPDQRDIQRMKDALNGVATVETDSGEMDAFEVAKKLINNSACPTDCPYYNDKVTCLSTGCRVL